LEDLSDIFWLSILSRINCEEYMILESIASIASFYRVEAVKGESTAGYHFGAWPIQVLAPNASMGMPTNNKIAYLNGIK